MYPWVETYHTMRPGSRLNTIANLQSASVCIGQQMLRPWRWLSSLFSWGNKAVSGIQILCIHQQSSNGWVRGSVTTS